MRRATTWRWRLLASLAAAALVLAACGTDDDDDGAAGDDERRTIALAFVGPLTGDNANLGLNIRDGARVALEEANEASERYRYVLKEHDTQGDPAQAPGQADRYIPDTEVIAVVGPTFSGETRAVLPRLQQAGLAMLSASATAVDLPDVVADQTVFHRLVPDDDVQATGLADYIEKGLEAGSGAYIHDNTDYGQGLFAGVVELLNARGVNVTLTDAIDPRSQDYSVAVNKIRDASTDIVFYGGYYAEAGRFKRQLTDAGVTATFISGDGSLDPGFIQASGAAGGEGALITCACRLATADMDDEVGEFARTYREVIGRDAGTYSSEGYDAVKLLVSGIEDGNDTRESLLEWLEGLDSYDGVSKTVQFEANGNVRAGDVFIYEVKEGRITELGRTSELLD